MPQSSLKVAASCAVSQNVLPQPSSTSPSNLEDLDAFTEEQWRQLLIPNGIDHNALNRHFDSPTRTRGHGCTINFHGNGDENAPYIAVLWTDPRAQDEGQWRCHYAYAGKPEQPISLLDMHLKGWHEADFDGKEWVADLSVPHESRKTFNVGSGAVLALEHEGKLHFARSVVPAAMMNPLYSPMNVFDQFPTPLPPTL
ncbi:hypothetical protein MIND_00548100 [Mycena indigotica]|uniref:Uncharacterized protein n=1 Tax=Mycena indigotica TaxID=2126181 RepID=A0A8H6WAD6_9AGAR|nr:uncharacterized protein MIND_00548100 [Mycena indigotica]KAF7307533.1 hypothetical protein MIND_00548100 [Mycena indigotica]